MRYLALCCDYDGTIATRGRVPDDVVAALERVAESGRHLVLVTGRVLPDLQEAFGRLDLFELVVAENGALLYRPTTGEERVLSEAPPAGFAERLREAGVKPLSTGRVIVATWEPHEGIVLETIREMGLELHVIFNKGAVMVLPSTVNKASGLAVALQELGLSMHNAVGVGDAENDHAFLNACECSVAVANALPSLKERCDVVTGGDHGRGVIEIADALIADDLRSRTRPERTRILLGRAGDDELWMPTYGENLLVVGPSGSGKSTFMTGILERLGGAGYQFCVVDPEGDYHALENAVVIGTPERAPSLDEIFRVLDEPRESVAANLTALKLEDRPELFAAFLGRLQQQRLTKGRPHWVMVDELHHVLPATWAPASSALPESLENMLFVTVHPQHVSAQALSRVCVVVAVGERPRESLAGFASAAGLEPPALELEAGESGSAVYWRIRNGAPPRTFRIEPSRTARRRHVKKYAEGEMPPEYSFYFRGPEGALNLRAQNLMLFVQIAEGVDDETWTHHLDNGDYAEWFRTRIKDANLAEEAERIASARLQPRESRQRIAAAIRNRYTAPA